MAWVGPQGITNRQMTDYVTRNTTCLIYLNGIQIDSSPCLSLSEKVFDALSGKIFQDKKSTHFKGGDLSHSEYVRIHEERLGLRLRGKLELIHKRSGKVIQEARI